MHRDAAQQAPPPEPTASPGVPHVRDPAVFTGADGTDVEDWLPIYERVSVPHRWDTAGKLCNLVFYHAGVASLWVNNHASKCPAWSSFNSAIIDVFVRPAVSKLQAEQHLSERAQQAGESFDKFN